MSAYLKNIDRGYPGTPSRANLGGFAIESHIAGATEMYYGMPVSIDTDGRVIPFNGTATRNGFLVRPFPKQGQATILGNGDPTYEGEMVSVMFRGYMTVQKDTAATAPGGAVYAVPVTAGTPPTATVSATAPGSGVTQAIPEAVFMDQMAAGTSEIAEIAIKM